MSVVYSGRVDCINPEYGSGFEFRCYLSEGYQDMPEILVRSGGFEFRAYPTSATMREMAKHLLALAGAADEAKAVGHE